MALAKCRECGQQVSDQAESCPSCGISDPSGNKAVEQGKGCLGCFGVILLLSILVTVWGSGSDSGSSTSTDYTRSSTPPSRSSTTTESLELLGHDSEGGQYGNWYVVGRVKNNTSQTYDYVQVSVNLYDSNGNQVGSTLDNVNGLEPGNVWRFRALVSNDRARRYKISDVTGY